MKPPLLETLEYKQWQLDANNKQFNTLNLARNTYELNDNPFTFLYPDPTMEGEFYDTASINDITFRFKKTQDIVFET